MSTKLSHVAAAVYERPWYVQPDVLHQIDRIVQLHIAGGRLSSDEIAERVEAASTRNGPRGGSQSFGDVAVIPIYGLIMPRANLMTEFSGGATVEGIRSAFRYALADEQVGSILFDVDSPGGYTDGIEELAAEIRESRGRKPIVAISDYCMASAAYYLGSQADEVVASPSSVVGWIGTVTIHQEFSKADEMAGVTTTIIRNPPGKFGANEYEPLSDAARTAIQDRVDERSAQFYSAVSKGRGVPVSTVKSEYGAGDGMTASKAKAAGLVDRVDTLDGTLRRMASGKITSRASTAAIAGGEALSLEDGRVPEPPPTPEPEPEPVPDRSKEAEAALALARARSR